VQDPLFAAEKRFREDQIHLEVNYLDKSVIMGNFGLGD
jgi:hypothetical protein